MYLINLGPAIERYNLGSGLGGGGGGINYLLPITRLKKTKIWFNLFKRKIKK